MNINQICKFAMIGTLRAYLNMFQVMANRDEKNRKKSKNSNEKPNNDTTFIL